MMADLLAEDVMFLVSTSIRLSLGLLLGCLIIVFKFFG